MLQKRGRGHRLAARRVPHEALSCSRECTHGNVRGIARGLGAKADDVSSPTFTIIQQYSGGGPTLYHVDLYRLNPDEVDDLGLDDLVSGDGIVAIEWAERWRGRPDDVVEVRLAEAGDNERTVDIRSNRNV